MESPALPSYVSNHNLFQDYFLKNRLSPYLPFGPPEFTKPSQETSKDEIQAILNKIYGIWTSWKGRLSESEDNVISCVKEVCEVLGMVHSGQGSVPRAGTIPQRVDITLFRDIASSERFTEAKSSRKQYTTATATRYFEALTVVEVEHLHAKLDKKQNDNSNPSYQITQYLTLTGIQWGILTDGARWRIYHRFDPPRFDLYFEVNLQKILDIPDDEERLEAFLWFYAFFNWTVFDRSRRRTFLDEVLAGSEQYAIEVRDNLRAQAFAVVEALAQGMAVNYPKILSEEDLTNIYEAAINILYRLLFIKYAEDMSILPVDNSNYQNVYGFSKLQNELLSQLDNPRVQLGQGSGDIGHWKNLCDFFEAIDKGKRSAGIYGYNGSLFKPERIASVIVPDYYLARAIDQLARVEMQTSAGVWQKQRVDYRSLDVRHLGSIYEGLLEQRLKHDGSTVRVTSNRNMRNNERKTTGSYYTPDYVVDYIVSTTIDPLCEGKAAEQVEKIKILDPAMGSGHFLVSSLKRLAIHHARTLKKQTISASAISSEAKEDYSALTQPDHNEVLASSRLLVERCIYGIDLNPLAVELAKLSLWLFTLSQHQPFSFLDHHLKVGNSLLGSPLDNLGELRKSNKHVVTSSGLVQLNLFAYAYDLAHERLLKFLDEIIKQRSDTIDAIHMKDKIYGEFREFSKPFIGIANLWLSNHFSNSIFTDHYQKALDALLSFANDQADIEPWQKITQTSWFINAQAIAERLQFFHWQLEFPDVFFQLDQNATGFDAVVGNPPYINAIELNAVLSEYEKPYWKTQFVSAQGAYDIYILFIEKSLQLVREGGIVGLITPNKYLAAPYAVSLREYLIGNHTIERFRDLSRIPIFADASVYPIISIITRGQKTPPYTIWVEQVSFDAIKIFEHSADLLKSLPDYIWGFLLTESNDLIQKVVQHSEMLDSVAIVNASTATSEADNFGPYLAENSNPQPDAGWKIINTGLIDPYASLWGLSSLTHQHKQYLHPVLPKKAPVVSKNRQEQYSKPKIIFAKMALKIESFADTEGLYASMNTNFAFEKPNRVKLLFLAAICNSRLLSWIYEQYFGSLTMSGRYYQFQAPQLKTLPIPRIAFETQRAERIASVNLAVSLYANGSYEKVIAFSQEQLIARPAHSDVIHDVLAYLAQQMLQFNRQYQTTREAFMTDIEGLLSPSEMEKIRSLWLSFSDTTPLTDAKKPRKGIDLQEQEQNVTLGSLSEDQWKMLLKKKLGTVLNLSDMVSVYRKHHTAIAEVTNRLIATDCLIDQIVYRLFGLNAEDIKAIEKSKTPILE